MPVGAGDKFTRYATNAMLATRISFRTSCRAWPSGWVPRKDTQALSADERVRRWVNVERPVLRKLEQLD